MHNRYIHHVWTNSLAKAGKCRLEYSQLLAVCELGEQQGRGAAPETPPTPGHTCPAPGLMASKHFVVILAVVVCQKRQSLIINNKISFVWHTGPSLWLPTSPAATTGGKTLQKASLSPGFSYLYTPSNTFKKMNILPHTTEIRVSHKNLLQRL